MPSPKLRTLSKVFWLLDYDGSLCPHREEWEFGYYDPIRLSQILGDLARLSAGVMWNTGRKLESLGAQHSDFLKYEGFFEHGARFWRDGVLRDLVQSVIPPEVVGAVQTWIGERADWVRGEYKAHSLRLIPLQARDRARLRQEFLQSHLYVEAQRPGAPYTVCEGWRALELLGHGVNKANALAILQAEDARFAKSKPLVVGDDVADAGVVQAALAAGGMAFLVGDHCGWLAQIPHRAGQVRFFREPQDVLTALAEIVALGGIPEDFTLLKHPKV